MIWPFSPIPTISMLLSRAPSLEHMKLWLHLHPREMSPLGRTAEASLVIQTSVLLLALPSLTAWGVCFQFLSVAEIFWGAWGGMYSVVTHAQHPLQMVRVQNSKQNKGPEAGFPADKQTDRPAVLQNKTLLPVLSVKPELPHSAQNFLCAVRVTSHPGLDCPICKPFNNGNSLSYFAHQNTCRLLPNKRTWQMSRG